jgi:prepilin signal peptidase PulO-like enzyme (type II secretory pathway)
MKVSHADHKLAMGPYLSAGILTTILFGGPIVNVYINLLSGLMGM